jgi:hypothetical protein
MLILKMISLATISDHYKTRGYTSFSIFTLHSTAPIALFQLTLRSTTNMNRRIRGPRSALTDFLRASCVTGLYDYQINVYIFCLGTRYPSKKYPTQWRCRRKSASTSDTYQRLTILSRRYHPPNGTTTASRTRIET